MANDNEDVKPVPSGSTVSPEEGKTQPTEEETAAAAAAAAAEEEIPEKFKGKSVADVAAAYANLETKIGDQSSELGELRRQNELLINQVSGLVEKRGGSETTDDTPPDYDSQLKDIQKQVEDGDLDISEAIGRASAITAQIAYDKAMGQFSERLQERDATDARDAFLEENPDFTEVQASGILDEIKAKNPLHDDFSAYFALQAQQEAANKEQAIKEALEAGKTEQAALEAGIATARGKGVLGKTGASIREQAKTTEPLSPKQVKESMTAVLEGLQEGSQ